MPWRIAQHSFLKVGTSVAALSGSVSWLMQAPVGNPSAWQSLLTVLVSVGTVLGALVLKEHYDRRKATSLALTAAQRNDGLTIIEREKILDGRVDTLFEELKAFYALKDKEKDQTILLLKEFVAQRDTLVTQQRELITQQATSIQQMIPKL